MKGWWWNYEHNYENHICELRSEELFEGRSSQPYTQLFGNSISCIYNCDDLPSNNIIINAKKFISIEICLSKKSLLKLNSLVPQYHWNFCFCHCWLKRHGHFLYHIRRVTVNMYYWIFANKIMNFEAVFLRCLLAPWCLTFTPG